MGSPERSGSPTPVERKESEPAKDEAVAEKRATSRSRSRSPAAKRSKSRSRSPKASKSKRSRSRSRSPRRSRSRSRSRGRRSRSRSRDRRRSRSPYSDEETLELDDGSVAYLLGRGGQTKQRLATFTGASLEIDSAGSSGRGVVSIRGEPSERDLARLCIDITLQQRNNGRLKFDVDALKARTEVTTLDVEQEAVGFLLGSKGATLRGLETKHRTFMFFDNDKTEGGKKRLYILGKERNRDRAYDECKEIISYKMGNSGRQVSSWRSRYRSRSRSPRRYGGSSRSYRRDDYYSRGRRSRSRSRSPRRRRSRS